MRETDGVCTAARRAEGVRVRVRSESASEAQKKSASESEALKKSEAQRKERSAVRKTFRHTTIRKGGRESVRESERAV